MKKTTLSTIKELSNIKEIKKSNGVQYKGGYSLNLSSQIDIGTSFHGNGLGFVPPPGK